MSRMKKVYEIRRKRVMKLIEQLMNQGYTQSRLAALAGIAKQHMCCIMKGRRPPSELFIFRLSYALGTDPGILLYGKAKGEA